MTPTAASQVVDTFDHKSNPLWHLKDLQHAACQDLNVNTSLGNLITEAENCLRQAIILLDHRKPDSAYRYYLRTYEIAVTFIPQNPLYPDFKLKRNSSHTRYITLTKNLEQWSDRFVKVKDIIVNDNTRNATRPRLPSAQTQFFEATSDRRPLRHVDTAPPVSPKPHSLHGSPVESRKSNPPSSPFSDPLAQRFERLRLVSPPIDTGKHSSKISHVAYSAQTSPVIARGEQYLARRSLDNTTNEHPPPSPILPPRPSGPRPMSASTQPAHDSVTAKLPQAPSPAYTTARAPQAPIDRSSPRSARSSLGYPSRNASLTSSVSQPSRPAHLHRESASGNVETRIGAEKLYDCLNMYDILVIDVRTRRLFDRGHIEAHSVMCIEPTALRKDMSADALQDALVLSPDAEQQMFRDRHKYDLVLYHDQSTTSDQFIQYPRTEAETTLRYLYDALHIYNQDRPLNKPPILLMGGLDSWSDLVGSQALAKASGADIHGQNVRRVPLPSNDSALQVTRKRLRGYNPLDAQEEQKWHERARQESVVLDKRDPSVTSSGTDHVNLVSPFADSIEDFNRRFPEASNIASTADSKYQAPSPPPKIPLYPDASHSSPSSSHGVPAIPTRPAPAIPRMSYSGVNERSTSQTKSADLPAYISPHRQLSALQLPRTGLVNFGVTCYMNATVQALSATLPLSMFFHDDKYEKLVQFENWKGSKGVLPNLFANLVRNIWKGDVKSIRPTTLRAFCGRLNPEWGIDRQQDAKEFFDFLVDCLHEDLNVNWARTPLRALTAEQEIQRERMPKLVVSREEWSRYLHRESSYLTSLFGGQHASRLKCTTCNFTSTTYEAFYSLSVEIPRASKSSIYDCLKSYCAEEMLAGDEVWKCPRCNKQREARKKITLTRMPQFLVIHFKRFRAGKGESAKKVCTQIEFPLENFKVDPYVLSPPDATEASAIAHDYGTAALKTDVSTTPPYTYEAYAVMRHIGTTLTSGHYTCLARDRAKGCWRHYNDTAIGDFDPEKLATKDRLQNEMAYIVFYQRVPN